MPHWQNCLAETLSSEAHAYYLHRFGFERLLLPQGHLQRYSAQHGAHDAEYGQDAPILEQGVWLFNKLISIVVD